MPKALTRKSQRATAASSVAIRPVKNADHTKFKRQRVPKRSEPLAGKPWDDCFVCLEEVDPGKAIHPAGCRHGIHIACVLEMLRYGHLLCGVCRKPFTQFWRSHIARASPSTSHAAPTAQPQAPVEPAPLPPTPTNFAAMTPEQKREYLVRLLAHHNARILAAEAAGQNLAPSAPALNFSVDGVPVAQPPFLAFPQASTGPHAAATAALRVEFATAVAHANAVRQVPAAPGQLVAFWPSQPISGFNQMTQMHMAAQLTGPVSVPVGVPMAEPLTGPAF